MSEELTKEQRAAVETIDRNIALSAGAGSGKTKVLVDRYLYLLEHGVKRGEGRAAVKSEEGLDEAEECGAKVRKGNVTPTDILAITFTRKAAGEMRSRIREKLLAKIEEAGASKEAEASCGFWREQLRRLELAQISTIHSLCSRILRENPVKSGLDPNFALLEDFDRAGFEEKCLEDYLESESAAGSKDLKLLLETYGFDSVKEQLPRLGAGILDVPKGYDLAASCREEEAGISVRKAAAGLKGTLRELIKNSYRPECYLQRGNESALQKKIWLIEEHLDEIEEGLDRFLPDTVLYDKLAKFKGGKRSELLDAGIKELNAIRAALSTLMADRAAGPCARAWQSLARGFAEFLGTRKLEASSLGFDDLERMAVGLLESDKEVLRRYREAFSYIMVDEFQDTNERQRRLVYLLAGGDADELKDTRLFVVGDPKQSIYRFRGADVSVFRRVKEDIGPEGCLELSVNFRSRESVLNAVNTVFSELMDTPGDFSELAPSRANRGAGKKPVLLEVRCGRDNKSGEESRADETERESRNLKFEFEALAREMKALRKESGMPYEDMTVLMDVMTKCDILTDALRRHGIPYRVVDGKGFYERQEVLDLLHVFKAARNRRRSLELAGALRSPYFGLSDATLTALFIKGNAENKCLWDTLQELSGKAGEGKSDLAEKLQLDVREANLVARAADTLSKLREFAALSDLPEFLRKAWKLLHVELCLKLQDEGETKLANARKLRRLAEEYAAEKDATLGAWLDHVADLARKALEDRGMVAETAANTAGGGVEIMTIHKSKGLERRAVFVPMLGISDKPDRDQLKLRRCAFEEDAEPSWRLGVKAPLPDGTLEPTSDFNRLKETDKELEREEGLRKLYVAMTRAKEVLVLSGVAAFSSSEKGFIAKGWLADVLINCGEDISRKEIYEYDLKPEDAQEAPEEREAKDAKEVLGPEALSLTEPLASYARPARREFSPSELQEYLYCQRRYFYQYVLRYPEIDLSEGAGSGLPARVIGNIVHKALELYHKPQDNAAGTHAREAFERAVSECAPGAEAQEAQELFLGYIGSSLYETAKEESRELDFTLPVDDTLVFKGKIDRLARRGGAIKITDFKTGSLGKDSKSLKGYELQLAVYKAAAERMFPDREVTAELHFLKGEPRPEAWGLTERGAALEEAIGLCREISAKTQEDQFARAESAENAAACRRCPYSYACRRERRS